MVSFVFGIQRCLRPALFDLINLEKSQSTSLYQAAVPFPSSAFSSFPAKEIKDVTLDWTLESSGISIGRWPAKFT